MMIFVMFAGCSGAGQNNPDESKSAGQEETQSAEVSESDAVSLPAPIESSVSSSGSPVADSYTAFVNAKTVPFTKLSDGLSNNEQTLWASMSLLGVAMVDMGMIPVAFFGLGEEAAAAGLAMLGAEGVQYSENGNSYTISYTSTDADGNPETAQMTGTFDAAADSLVCTGSTNGVENFYSEYRKTAYGYIGQYYFSNDDGTASYYVMTVQGEDGTFGLSTTPSGKPSALTGSEPYDYPSTLPEWYAINGSTITGKMSDGTDVNFEYVPSETASN